MRFSVHVDPVENDSEFVYGTIKGPKKSYRFMAKVYDVPSGFGIDSGRISKLKIENADKDTIAFEGNKEALIQYNRNWDIPPKNEHEYDMLASVIETLEKIPPYRERIYNGSKIKKAIGQVKNILASN